MSAPTTNQSDAHERCLRAGELAAPIYAAHHWLWGHSSDKEVPSAERIGARIWSLYQEVEKQADPGACVSTGRLSVWIDEDDGSIAVDVHLADLRDPLPDSEWETFKRDLLEETAA